MRSLRILAGCAAALAITALAAGGAKANSLELDTTAFSGYGYEVLNPGAGLSSTYFDWRYDFKLTAGYSLVSGTPPSGSYANVFDFTNLSGGQATGLNGANGWSYSESATGPTPAAYLASQLVPITDSASFLNATANYTGTGFTNDSTTNPSSTDPFDVLQLDLFSNIGPGSPVTTSSYDYVATDYSLTSTPTGPYAYPGTLIGPSITNRVANTPEPAFYQMGGLLGLACIGGIRRRIKGLKLARIAA